jgi:ubiquinone/menaquinone biosynthesis C-methylase UbiE
VRENESYSLRLGDDDVDRLGLVNRYYNPGSQRLLRSVSISGARRVADIGCGQGDMAHWIAGELGPSGQVVGVDMSPEQLQLAELRCPHPERVRWVCCAAECWDGSGGAFDIVYCRLLLMHVSDPAAVLRSMIAALRPGGLLVIETARVDALRYVPERAGADRWQEWWYRLGDVIGASYRFADQALPLVRGMDMKIVSAEVHQPVSYDRAAKLIHPLGFEQLVPAYRDRAGADPLALREQLAIFRDLIDCADTYVELYAMLQLVAQRPAAATSAAQPTSGTTD